MKIIRTIAFMATGLSLSACAAVETVSRDAPFDAFESEAAERIAVSTPADDVATAQFTAAPVRVQNVAVQVPRSLKVSEANRYLPAGDIVWRGEPRGDRHAQVKRIFETAMLRGVKSLNGPIEADLLINVHRFHALTEKARYSVGGVHNISFSFALADPATGQMLTPWREVRADLKAFGGQQAINAEAAGQTQKVRITGFLSQVIQDELTKPGGHKNAELGLIQKLNQI